MRESTDNEEGIGFLKEKRILRDGPDCEKRGGG